MANARGTVHLVIGGKKRGFKASFENIVAIEQTTGKAIFRLAQDAAMMEMSLAEITQILHSSMMGTNVPDIEKFGPQVFKLGIVNVMPTVVEILTSAISTGEEEAGNEEGTENE